MSQIDLGRVIALLDVAQASDGWLTTDEAARVLGCRPSQVARLAVSLTDLAVPPFGPGDAIDVDLPTEGWLHVTAPEGWSRWTELPLADVGLLVAALRVLARGLDRAERVRAERLREKLLRSLHAVLARQVSSRAETVGFELAEVGDPAALTVVLDAVRARWVVVLDYYNHSRDEIRERRVRPHRVVQHDGRWYLSASDAATGAHRLWRLDRVLAAHATHEPFEGDGPGDDHFRREVLFDRPSAWVEVVLAVDPEALDALCAEVPGVVVDGDGVRVRAPTLAVAMRWLLGSTAPWRVLGPPEALEWLARLER